jgi:hypothetical protein
MSDREAFEKWWPSVGQTIGKVAAWEAWQAALQSGEPVVDVAGMDEEDAMFTQIEAKARATYRRHSFSAKGQIFTKADSYESHLVWAAIDWAKANTTPQPVNQQLVEALKACEECLMFIHGGEPLRTDVPLRLAREALLSAGKGDDE